MPWSLWRLSVPRHSCMWCGRLCPQKGRATISRLAWGSPRSQPAAHTAWAEPSSSSTQLWWDPLPGPHTGGALPAQQGAGQHLEQTWPSMLPVHDCRQGEVASPQASGSLLRRGLGLQGSGGWVPGQGCGRRRTRARRRPGLRPFCCPEHPCPSPPGTCQHRSLTPINSSRVGRQTPRWGGQILHDGPDVAAPRGAACPGPTHVAAARTEGRTRNPERPQEHRKRSVGAHSPSLQTPIPRQALWSRGPRFHTTPVWEPCSFPGLGLRPRLRRRCCRHAGLLAWLKIAQSSFRPRPCDVFQVVGVSGGEDGAGAGWGHGVRRDVRTRASAQASKLGGGTPGMATGVLFPSSQHKTRLGLGEDFSVPFVPSI